MAHTSGPLHSSKQLLIRTTTAIPEVFTRLAGSTSGWRAPTVASHDWLDMSSGETDWNAEGAGSAFQFHRRNQIPKLIKLSDASRE